MRKKRSQRRRKRRQLVLLAAAVLIVALICGGIWWLVTHSGGKNEEEAAGLLTSPDSKEIMVMGVDPRTDDTGRSDTLFIVSLNEKEKKASVLSIPRDTRVEMEQGAYEKINHAYAYGGHEYSQQVLEKLLATKIDGYLIVNIRAFEKMIDAVGGVDIDVEKRMYYEDPWDDDGGLVIDLQPGEQHLDGKQAMEYVRFRDDSGDIGRIARQQKFLNALLDRAASPEVVSHLPQLVHELGGLFETNFELGDIVSFTALLPDIKGNGIKTAVLPGKPGWWQETSYWVPDIKAARQQMASQMGTELTPELTEKTEQDVKEYLASLPKNLADVDGTMRITASGVISDEGNSSEKGTSESKSVRPENIRVRVLNCSGINGAGAESANVLRQRGFSVNDKDVGNGPTRDRQKTVLKVPKGTESLFRNLPFPCDIQTGDDDTAVLEIGKDYNDA